MPRIGDIVIYKDSYDKFSGRIHPAVVTDISGDVANLTVFFNGGTPSAVALVPAGTPRTDTHCWWERE